MTVKTATLADMERRDLPERTDYRGKPTRRLETQWIVKSGTTDDGSSDYEVVAQVTTSHYGKAEYYGQPDKVFKSRFGWEVNQKHTNDDGSVTGMTKWQSDWKSISVDSVPVARYAKKALVAAHEAAVAKVLDLYEGSNLEEVVEQAAAYEGSKW